MGGWFPWKRRIHALLNHHRLRYQVLYVKVSKKHMSPEQLLELLKGIKTGSMECLSLFCGADEEASGTLHSSTMPQKLFDSSFINMFLAMGI